MLFNLAIAAGIAAAAYLYGHRFEEFSEQELIAWSPYWFLPLVYGVHGKIAAARVRARGLASYAERIKTAPEKSGARDSSGSDPWQSATGNPYVIALAATVFWGLLLWLFLNGIFPSL